MSDSAAPACTCFWRRGGWREESVCQLLGIRGTGTWTGNAAGLLVAACMFRCNRTLVEAKKGGRARREPRPSRTEKQNSTRAYYTETGKASDQREVSRSISQSVNQSTSACHGTERAKGRPALHSGQADSGREVKDETETVEIGNNVVMGDYG